MSLSVKRQWFLLSQNTDFKWLALRLGLSILDNQFCFSISEVLKRASFMAESSGVGGNP